MPEELEKSEQEVLHEAIEGLYQVFASYELRREIHACTHCVFPEDHERLRSRPLRQLQGDDLQRYAFKAMTTWGDALDFKHFLPRLFELWAGNAIFLVSDEQLITRLERADWRSWPADEQEAVEQFLSALWKATLTSLRPEAYIILPALADAFLDMSPLLADWRELCSRSDVALRQLVNYIDDVARYGTELENIYQHQNDQIITWLHDAATFALLEEAFFRYGSDPFAANISRVLDQLVWISS